MSWVDRIQVHGEDAYGMEIGPTKSWVVAGWRVASG